MRKVILYIACSLDGYIAKPEDDLSFLEIVAQEGEDYGYHAFLQTVDTVLVGRKTYDWVMKHVDTFPHADRTTYVITRTQRPPQGNIIFYNGALGDLIAQLKSESQGTHIFCDGGGDLVNALLQGKYLDEIILSIIPILVGDGTKLFQNGLPEQKLQLLHTQSFPSGLVQLHYAVQR
ncbi:MAG TPA: dihydrofolate reductase [Microscillaceae bacterium]|nr:dihydrofolate reductase [Microscillaceae bacterium]